MSLFFGGLLILNISTSIKLSNIVGLDAMMMDWRYAQRMHTFGGSAHLK